MAVAAAQQAAAMQAAESRAQAAMMVEAVEDRAYEVAVCPKHSSLVGFCVVHQCVHEGSCNQCVDEGPWIQCVREDQCMRMRT